ncbi:3-dehydroquinate synthase [Pyrobaculum neutrophilum]|uniref:3-dehydroquinate synthase n=1 Tax=Pyrobaculum neutrophilum (strain DSM 2338 / JCM 9278 / NBRC 100436 / V24Sta) TaxID=444157 RepID=AROB_PYRNV|nr:3-dehydroquinate synthase family protein [Pyrobaculum neutrophilum]B1YD64.1 RecName: Full=3-dehydroquinate synthase; Short=DHQS [Pyrobaculum neutrophilum V24Sta]ACB39727.1 3-dehydroquinate synthase [Pyrobaculum neutrophilum V24Sta]
MRRFFYRHSRGVTEVVVGSGLQYGDYVERPVVLAEEGLRPPIPGAPTLALRGGEEVKSLEVLTKVYGFLKEVGADRSTTLVAVGGGALLDLATFAAGTYMRGIRLVHIPTTLLAMVDAALGGKGAVDWGPVKNLIGVFYQPAAILCDLSWLGTLPERVYRSAFAEVVKYGLALDGDFYSWVRENAKALLARDGGALEYAVYRSLQLKAGVVEVDEFEERGVRQVLNVGHTVGHAVERVLGLLHGEAVAVGMVAELRLSSELGYLRESHVAEAAEVLSSLGLPTSVKATEQQLAEAAALVKFDKKRRGGHIYIPLVVRPGRWILEKIAVEEVEKAVRYVLRQGG